MDLVILVLMTLMIVLLCDKNNSPNFLSKILYNSEFKDEKEEHSFNKNRKRPKKNSRQEEEQLTENLDVSTEEELTEFDPSSEADDLISKIKGE